MKPLAKFLFETSFDRDDQPSSPDRAKLEIEVVPAPPPPPAEPSYGEADISAARQDGYARGVAEAEAAARTSIDQATAAALAAIAGALPDLARRFDDGLGANARLMLETSLAGLRRLLPELSRRGGLVEVESLLQQTIASLQDESRIVVRLNDQLLDGLRNRLDEIARSAGFEGRFVLLADEDISASDCRIEWADGGVERIATRIWSDIEAAVTRCLAASYGQIETTAPHSTSTGGTQP